MCILWRFPKCRLLIPFYTELRVIILYFLRPRPPYSLGLILSVLEDEKAQHAIREELRRKSSLVETDMLGYQQWALPFGNFWIPPGSSPTFLFGVFAEQMRNVYGGDSFTIRPGEVVIDGGANLGAFVWTCLSRGAARVIACEVAPSTLECLRRNFAKEIADGRVTLYPKGLWDREEFLTLRMNPKNSGENGVVMDIEGGIEGPKVHLTTIDHLVVDLALERVDFIKMDIEGAEQKALEGAKVTLQRFHPRLAITSYHMPDDPDQIPLIVRSAWSGYTICPSACVVHERMIRPNILLCY